MTPQFQDFTPDTGVEYGSVFRPQKLRGNAFSPADNYKNIEGFNSREDNQCSN